MPLPARHRRLDDAARFVGRSYAWLARAAWQGEVPFRLMRTTEDSVVSCRDLVFAERDLVPWQNDGAVRAEYAEPDRAFADSVARRLVRAGMKVEGT